MNGDLSNCREIEINLSRTYLVREKETISNMYTLYFQLMSIKKYNNKCNKKINLTSQKGKTKQELMSVQKTVKIIIPHQ